MYERTTHIDRYLTDLEMAYSLFGDIDSVEGISAERLSKIAVHAKRVEMKLAAARLAQAEFRLEALLARRDFLEARSVQGTATSKELEALDWAIDSLPAIRSALTQLTATFELLKGELNSLVNKRGGGASNTDPQD